MDQKAIQIIGGILLLILGVTAFMQMGNIRTKKQKIEAQQDSILSLEKILQIEKSEKEGFREENIRLSAANDQLETEKAELNEEVARLKKEIGQLKLRIKTQRETIEGIRAEIAEKEQRLADLNSQIANLSRKQKQEIAKVKDSLNMALTDLRLQSDALLAGKDSLVNEMLDKEEIQEVYKSSLEIIENTRVSFQLVSPRKVKDGKEIGRLKKGNWNFTQIEFSMYQDDMTVIQGETFIAKIVDSDTRKPMPMRETNPEFPESEINQMGISFDFFNNPVVMTHVNTEKKSGNSFELNVFLVRDGKEFLLRNGIVDIIRSGKPVEIGFTADPNSDE